MSAAERRRGLLVDYGGVLTNPLYPVIEDFCRGKGLSGDAVFALLGDGSPIASEVRSFEVGGVSEEEFMPRFAAALGLDVEDLREMFVELKPDPVMFSAVAEVRRQGVPTCLVSNSWGTSVYPRPWLAETFDAIVISEEVGLRKPDPAIFRHAAEAIGVEPRDCVFIDDMPVNFAGAEELQIAVIHHESVAATLAELERLLGVDLANIETAPGRRG